MQSEMDTPRGEIAGAAAGATNRPEDPLRRQPLLPQMRLKWTFAAVTAAAVLFALVRMAGQDAALVTAIVAIAGWLALLFGMFSILFLITYALGVLETLLAPPHEEVLSPFGDDRLPEQIVVPLKTDAQ